MPRRVALVLAVFAAVAVAGTAGALLLGSGHHRAPHTSRAARATAHAPARAPAHAPARATNAPATTTSLQRQLEQLRRQLARATPPPRVAPPPPLTPPSRVTPPPISGYSCRIATVGPCPTTPCTLFVAPQVIPAAAAPLTLQSACNTTRQPLPKALPVQTAIPAPRPPQP